MFNSINSPFLNGITPNIEHRTPIILFILLSFIIWIRWCGMRCALSFWSNWKILSLCMECARCAPQIHFRLPSILAKRELWCIFWFCDMQNKGSQWISMNSNNLFAVRILRIFGKSFTSNQNRWWTNAKRKRKYVRASKQIIFKPFNYDYVMCISQFR